MAGIVSSSNSASTNNAQINKLAQQVASNERTQLFKDDAGVRRVLLGKGLNDFYGLRVSKPDIDVYDATDDQLIFNSNQNVFKIIKTGTLEFSEFTMAGNGQAGTNPPEPGNGFTIDVGVPGFFMVIGQYIESNGFSGSFSSGSHSALVNSSTGEVMSWWAFEYYIYDGSIEIFRSGQNSSSNPLSINALTLRYYILQENVI